MYACNIAYGAITHPLGGNRNAINNQQTREKFVRNRLLDCHLSPHWRQMAIKNSISNDFYLRSSIVLAFSIAAYPKSINLNNMYLKGTLFKA